MRNKSVEIMDNRCADVQPNYSMKLNHTIMFNGKIDNAAVPLAQKKEIPPAGKASTVLKQSVQQATYGTNEDEIAHLQQTLSQLQIETERVSLNL